MNSKVQLALEIIKLGRENVDRKLYQEAVDVLSGLLNPLAKVADFLEK